MAPGSIVSSAGGALKGPYPQTREVQGKLEILRDYRDGKVSDLSDPWIFTDIGLSCELKQRVAGHEIAFRYPYAEQLGEYSYSIEFDNDGNPSLTNPMPVSLAFGQGMTREIDGPEFVPRSLSFSVQFLYYLKTERDTATVSIGERMWSLQSLTTRLLRDGRELSSHSIDLAFGETAQQIFDAMLTPSDVTVIGQATSAVRVTGAPAPIGSPGDVSFETKSTRFAAEAKLFQDCMDVTRSP